MCCGLDAMAKNKARERKEEGRGVTKNEQEAKETKRKTSLEGCADFVCRGRRCLMSTFNVDCGDTA
jgi:hypothetical protein